MAVEQQQQQQDRSPHRPKGKIGYFGSFEELIASGKPRPSSPTPAKPTAFGYGWEPHPTSPNLLVNPGLDSRDPLAGTVAPRQLTRYLGRHHHPQFGRHQAGQTPGPKHKPRPTSEEEQLRVDSRNHWVPRKTCPTSGRIEEDARASLERPRRRIFEHRLDRVRPAPKRTKVDYGLDPSKKANTSSLQDLFAGKPSTANSIGIRAPPFPRSQQAEYLRLAAISKLPARKPARVAKSPRHLPAPSDLFCEDYIAKTRQRRRELQGFTPRSKEARKDLFGSAGATNTKSSAKEVGNTIPGVKSALVSPADPSPSSHTPRGFRLGDTVSSPVSSPAAPPGAYSFTPEQSTVVIPPNRRTLVQVIESSGTRGFIVRGLDFKTIAVQRAGQETPSSDQGCPGPNASRFGQSCPPGCNTSRKRRAEESELDLVAANAAEQSPPEQEPLTTTPSAAAVASDEGTKPRGRAAWLINIMTSVRGAVTKVSSSIAGYVYPRNYNVVERHSRDQRTGNIATKRIKLELIDDSVDETMAAQQFQVVNPETPKINLVWVDESTRVAHWHQVAPLVRALRSISRRIEKGLSGSRDGSPASRADDDVHSQRIYTLGAYVTIFQQTAFVLESVYSHTFLAKLKDAFRFPQSIMDYDVSPDEFLAIAAAKKFVENFPDECSLVLTESGVTQRVLKGIGTDLDALANQRPMPSLVQRAGLVGKVMKFFRGRDSFGVEASDDPVSKIAVEMPGSFPDTQVKSESVVEEVKPPMDVPEHRPVTKPNYLPPVRTTDTYTFVREHLAEIATKRRTVYKERPAGMTPEDLLPRPSPISILKKDSQSPVVLKRLQKARGLKRVQFSPSAKPSTLSPAKPTSFFNRLFGSPLRQATENSSLSDAQTDGSPDSRGSERPDRHAGTEPETDNTSEDSDGEAVAARCQPRLVRHLNESLNGLEAKGFFVKDESREASSCPPSPPTLAGLNISDDKEEELEDLSLALQLLLDVDEARRREEEERKAKEAEEEKLRKTGGLRVPRRRLITSLPADWSQKVSALLQAHPSKTLAVTAESVELRKHDFAKVVPETEWLNDEIVNGSLQWLDRYINAAAGATDVKSPNRVCLAMGSFFYKRLEDNGVQNTERALRRYGVTRANFLKLETILMPICKNNHWTLLVVRPQKRTVSHMDSLNQRGSAAHTNRALAWVEAFLGNDYKASEWRTVCHEAPLQMNGYDCGVFTITNAICLALGLNAIDTYSGEDLPLQRLRIAGMLLNKGFSGEFDLAGL
ncbi:ulp1 protease family protein [Colletotrichum incanum]|uniref:Ulp1 protease family protein n=1 Tax=Colletotrichum incanum TaxID=1573173 RepID=A0A167D892_COLIC|nr:ulp1 protease family protein [Colletotrichum incanum]